MNQKETNLHVLTTLERVDIQLGYAQAYAYTDIVDEIQKIREPLLAIRTKLDKLIRTTPA